VWNFFRLENEHLNNCGQFRAVRDISIAPMNSNDQALLEQMMDEEDGVTNRRSAIDRKYRLNAASSRLLSATRVYQLVNQSIIRLITHFHRTLHAGEVLFFW